jgi:hypothetical protein
VISKKFYRNQLVAITLFGQKLQRTDIQVIWIYLSAKNLHAFDRVDVISSAL